MIRSCFTGLCQEHMLENGRLDFKLFKCNSMGKTFIRCTFGRTYYVLFILYINYILRMDIFQEPPPSVMPPGSVFQNGASETPFSSVTSLDPSYKACPVYMLKMFLYLRKG